MSITAEARTLVGPTPTPFTGDRAQAQRFLVEFLELDRRNRRHPLIIRPTLRVELALSYIHGPLTTSWRHTIRLGGPRPSEDETIWDEFYDLFCTAWIDDPAPPVVAAPTQTPPPSPHAAPVPAPAVAEQEEDWTLFAPRVTPVPTPLVTPVVPRVEKRKRDSASDSDEYRPGKYSRAAPRPEPPRAAPQLARRSVPLPHKIVYKPRRAASAPVTSAPYFLVPYSPPPRRPPSPPNDPVHTPPLVDPDPRPLAPDRTVVGDDNTPTGGVKTLDNSVFAPVSAQDDAGSTPHTEDSRPQTPDTTDSSLQTPPRAHLFPRRAFERPRDPDELATDRRCRGNARAPYPATSRNHTKTHTQDEDRSATAAAPSTSPPQNRTATRNRDRPVRAARQHPGKPAQVKQQPDSQHPHRAETAGTTPVTNRANAAVEMFLRRYDATQTTPAPAAAPVSRAYDAVVQHLAYRLATDPDTTRITQPFALRPGPRAVLHKWKKT
ncbi:hypothetical protein EDB89DRAFT_1904635 [Lactarius sanguifluus]|nr:hypothetical protein EDB89DRAFT_1904635 [Lactarius sanguifluus]